MKIDKDIAELKDDFLTQCETQKFVINFLQGSAVT